MEPEPGLCIHRVSWLKRIEKLKLVCSGLGANWRRWKNRKIEIGVRQLGRKLACHSKIQVYLTDCCLFFGWFWLLRDKGFVVHIFWPVLGGFLQAPKFVFRNDNSYTYIANNMIWQMAIRWKQVATEQIITANVTNLLEKKIRAMRKIFALAPHREFKTERLCNLHVYTSHNVCTPTHTGLDPPIRNNTFKLLVRPVELDFNIFKALLLIFTVGTLV